MRGSRTSRRTDPPREEGVMITLFQWLMEFGLGKLTANHNRNRLPV